MDKEELQAITKLHSMHRRSLEPDFAVAELFNKAGVGSN